MEYTCLSWCGIPEVTAPTEMWLIEGCYQGLVIITSKVLHHLDNCYGIFVSQIIKQVSFAVVTIQSTFHLSWLFTAFFTRETRRVSLVVQEILTIPEHTNSPSVFSGVIDAHYIVFCVVLCGSLFVFLSFILLEVLLSVLQWTVSEFGIFNLFKCFNLTHGCFIVNL